MGRKKLIILDNQTAYLPGVKAAVTFSRSLIADPIRDPIKINFKDKNIRGVVPWGETNDLPQQIMKQIYESPVASSGLQFNISMGYGDGIAYGRWITDSKGKKKFQEITDNKEINEFFDDNDINNYLLEQVNDISFFYNIFPEIVLSKSGKIVELHHKEASFSRWGEMNPDTGLIDHHFYSARWAKSPQADEIDITPVLSPWNTVKDLKVRMGIIPDKNGRKRTATHYRFIIPVSLPTPGRNYYQKPYWFSIIESGWLEYSKKIPEFKNALLDNQMFIKYHVELSDDYFDKIFKAEGINEPKAQQERIKKEYQDLNNFLGKVKNTGKSVISFIRYSADGKELRRMKINVIDNKTQSGEYVEDSEEASNIISYAMGVHPSLIGSSPGKNKTISGSEARELFIIKQALMKPVRDRLLRPLYIIKRFNGWPEDIHFTIPNIVLTTLDRGTGSEKVIS